MEIVIRDATSSDLDLLAALNAVVQQIHADLEPDQFQADVDAGTVKEFFARVLSDGRNHVRLAIVDGRPVGYIWFATEQRPSTPFQHARRRIYVHQISVSDDARRIGVASDLMRAADNLAKAEGIDEVWLDTWAVNDGARQFFDKQGFAEVKLVLRKRLG